ncbi:hypothetical protein [Hydrogenophaga sp. R2]|uniref:hypothetical protein n=1 Tax=Hydrogenophaga sp. R2 TaxID=3132827 RepID=UPI003CEC8A80
MNIRMWAVAVCFMGSVQAAPPWVLTTGGYGAVTPGLSVSQAQRLMGTALRTFENQPLDPDCDHVYPASGHPGISLMVQNGRVTRIAADTADTATRSGARVGDTAESVRRLFGEALTIERHKYDDTGQYFYLWDRSGQRGIKFELIGGRVVAIYAGDASIRLVEGCA